MGALALAVIAAGVTSDGLPARDGPFRFESELHTGPAGRINTVATAQLDDHLVIAAGGDDIRVSDLAAGVMIGSPLSGYTGSISALAVTELAGRPVIVSAGQDTSVRVWDLATGTPIGQPITSYPYTVDSVATSYLGDRPVIVAAAGWAVRVWDLATGESIGQHFAGHEVEVNVVAAAQIDGRWVIISGSEDSTLRTWRS